MAADDPTKIRNVAIVGQGGVGKTLVADGLLFAAGAATRFGFTTPSSSSTPIRASGTASSAFPVTVATYVRSI